MLEVCVDSLESALAAVNGGASRLELCSARSEDGLTPSIGLLKVLKNKTDIPIYCMLRPRKGYDFCYSDLEMESVFYDLELLKANASDGFVFGALDVNKNINVDQCKQIVSKCGNLPVTFHKAFDLTNPDKMYQNCDLLQHLGFTRVLTSGFEKNAVDGIENLIKLVQKQKITIMPGGGVTINNIEQILLGTDCKEIHSSCSRKIKYGTEVDTGSVTDRETVEQLVRFIKSYHYSK